VSLLQQAHFDGDINLGEARPFDRHWRIKLVWTLDAVERRNFKQLSMMQHDLHCGAVTYLAGQKTLDTHWNQAIDLQSRVKKLLFPWLEVGDNTAVYKRLTTAWEHTYGRLDDPETQRKLDEAVSQLRKRAKTATSQ